MEKFPKAFLLGAATAAHQVEGNNIIFGIYRRHLMDPKKLLAQLTL